MLIGTLHVHGVGYQVTQGRSIVNNCQIKSKWTNYMLLRSHFDGMMKLILKWC